MRYTRCANPLPQAIMRGFSSNVKQGLSRSGNGEPGRDAVSSLIGTQFYASRISK